VFSSIAFKRFARSVSPPILFEWRKAIKKDVLHHFRKNGRIPWSTGYGMHKSRMISQVLNDSATMELFRSRRRLPFRYGYGIDERCIEYPWLLSRLEPNLKCILDAGSVLNHDFILSNSCFSSRRLHLLTSAPEQNCFWHKGISYIYDDLRRIPIRDDFYDAVVCVSTLEHVGCDNTAYTAEAVYSTSHLDDIEVVIRELRRVLKPGGTLLLSVPFGSYRHFRTFQQFDGSLLLRATKSFGDFSKHAETFYRYSSEGWQIATSSDCAECKYVQWLAESRLATPEQGRIPVEPDLAAAARAVACVELVKPTSTLEPVIQHNRVFDATQRSIPRQA
jgi:ubiquinone/menaquinone biosynthesis C-methylase UbiE